MLILVLNDLTSFLLYNSSVYFESAIRILKIVRKLANKDKVGLKLKIS